jgi:hypothetical protein
LLAIRTIMHAMQIIAYGKVIDFNVGNEDFEWMMKQQAETWEDLFQLYHPRINQYLDKLKIIVNHYKEFIVF